MECCFLLIEVQLYMDYKLVIFNTAALDFPEPFYSKPTLCYPERTQWKENINLIVLYSLPQLKCLLSSDNLVNLIFRLLRLF